MRTIIVGGVAGGMSAATRLRRRDEEAEIIVVEKGDYVSFANCGLPYYVGGVIEDRSALLLQTPESLAARFRLDVRTGTEAISIDRAAKRVTLRDVARGTETSEAYDHLVLSAGTTAGVLPGHASRVVTLRTIDDVDEITALLEARGDAPTRAVVAGAGFIGLEAVDNLVRRGVSTTLVQRGDQVFSPLDPELAVLVLDELDLHGVDVRLGRTVTSIDDESVTLDDGATIDADLVIDAIGVRPAVGLARAAGLSIGRAGGIEVDSAQRTSDPAIFAVGDAAEKVDAVDAAPTLVTMAGLANRHGRAVADTIAGDERPSRPALGTSIIGVFDLTAATVGWSEKRLRDADRAHRVIHTHPGSHAGYYPGAERMSMKLMVDPDTDLILGAQIVGGDGVDKRIDILATAMSAGITARGLIDLELAYAPQYGSAKDPVNLLGYVADNRAEEPESSIQWHELEASLREGAQLVDVRSAREFDAGAIPGAVNIPVDELRERLDEISSNVVVHCQVGQRGHTAARILAQRGYRVRNLDGGYLTWSAGVRTAGWAESALTLAREESA